MLVAWLSLGSQVIVLIGERGLVPVSGWLIAGRGLDFWQAPTLFWLDASDGALRAGTWLGALLSILALAGIAPRVMFALSIPLYLGYVTAARSFLAFQWDNLLLETLALALLLPAQRAAPVVHLLFRILVFKLYFESGIAKYQSHLGDWIDGSAMSFYYETSPLPTRLAWTAHHLPGWWHSLESRATLVLELLLPFGIFGPRAVRLIAFAALTGFQLVNLATANYGFFVYLALALHVFLLDDRDLERARRAIRRRVVARPRARRLLARGRRLARACPARFRLPALGPVLPARAATFAVFAVAAAYAVISLAQGLVRFHPGARKSETLGEVASVLGPFRLVNTYHLFGHITRERIEPELQTFDGRDWTAQHLFYKPNDPWRPPPFVAPHQPRVDFLLWFHGLSHRQLPDYVRGLLDRLCHEPGAVQPLFDRPLPAKPRAVRIVYFRHHFATPTEHAQSGAWWTRSEVFSTRSFACR